MSAYGQQEYARSRMAEAHHKAALRRRIGGTRPALARQRLLTRIRRITRTWSRRRARAGPPGMTTRLRPHAAVPVCQVTRRQRGELVTTNTRHTEPAPQPQAQPEPPPASCCSTTEQATCCEPAAKSECCGTSPADTASSSCGCR